MSEKVEAHSLAGHVGKKHFHQNRPVEFLLPFVRSITDATCAQGPSTGFASVGTNNEHDAPTSPETRSETLQLRFRSPRWMSSNIVNRSW